jgi:hypothetical protein
MYRSLSAQRLSESAVQIQCTFHEGGYQTCKKPAKYGYKQWRTSDNVENTSAGSGLAKRRSRVHSALPYVYEQDNITQQREAKERYGL